MTVTSLKCPAWTTRELAVLHKLRKQRMTLAEISKHLPGRSPKAIGNFISRQNAKLRPIRKPAPIPPAKHAAEEVASAALRDAVIRAIARYANDNGLHIDAAAQRLLSPVKSCG